MKMFHALKIVSEYDQEIPQSQTVDNPKSLRCCIYHANKCRTKVFPQYGPKFASLAWNRFQHHFSYTFDIHKYTEANL